MNTLIIITISSIGGGIVGFFVCAWLTAGKVADVDAEWGVAVDKWLARAKAAEDALKSLSGKWQEARAAHSRCADALATCQDRLHKIRVLSNSPDTIRKKDIRAVLGGDA